MYRKKVITIMDNIIHINKIMLYDMISAKMLSSPLPYFNNTINGGMKI